MPTKPRHKLSVVVETGGDLIDARAWARAYVRAVLAVEGDVISWVIDIQPSAPLDRDRKRRGRG